MKKRNYFGLATVLSICFVIMLLLLLPSVSYAQQKDGSGLDPNSEEYQKWKEQYAEGIWKEGEAGKPGLYVNQVKERILSNDFLSVSTNSNALFTIGTTGGNPDIATDNNKKLLFGHPSPSTSYTTLRIGGNSHVFSADTMKYDEENRIISSKRTYNQTITVEQRLSLIKNNATNREDVVEIRYIITNHSPIVQNVGLRIMMDTMLGSNDAAPFRVPGTGSVTTETEFRGLRIPQIWQAFESLTNSSVVSQGTFYKDYKNKPDAVQFTNWGNVYRMDWDYTVKKGSANGDSAVSVIWDEKDILPLQKKGICNLLWFE